MTERLSRAVVAKELGVTPITIYRWEKKGVSPAKPKRLLRTNELIYSREDVEKIRAWKDAVE